MIIIIMMLLLLVLLRSDFPEECRGTNPINLSCNFADPILDNFASCSACLGCFALETTSQRRVLCLRAVLAGGTARDAVVRG